MYSNIKELYSLLTKQQRARLFRLQLLILLMSFAEIASVGSIGPFMALVGDPGALSSNAYMAKLYQVVGAESPEQFLIWVGVLVLCVLVSASLLSMFTIWRLYMYSAQVGAELSSRLFKHYMHQSWLFHSSGSSSQLTNRIAQECQRVTNNIINPLMQMNARLVMASLMCVAIILYNPTVAVVGVVLFVGAYVFLYRIVRMRLANNGRVISESQRQRYKLMGEGFGGIKDVLVLGKQKEFVERFHDASMNFARSQGVTQTIGQVPRYAMELIAFGSIIFLILYLLASYDGDLGLVLPVISIYALAGFKLLPAFQQIYLSLSQIRSNMSAFESVRADFHSSLILDEQSKGDGFVKDFTLREDIVFDRVSFAYPEKEVNAINDLSLTIKAKTTVGFVGPSGSGKSTIVDLLLGLIAPSRGRIYIDGLPLDCSSTRAWQNLLGFVSQSIFLADSSIRENIAFGQSPEDIDDERVSKAASNAFLSDLLDELPDGLDTNVGERGVQLSGGQRQRIGIARALYHDVDVLVLDEATSALDGLTEKMIVKAIQSFAGQKTIVTIAHRLATIRDCDCIYFVENGALVDSGSYSELLRKNSKFRLMAENA